MFFQLPEIERIQSRTHQLSKQKQQLESTVTRAYTNKNKVQGSVNTTIDSVIEKAQKNLKIIQEIQQQAQNGYLIPEQFDLQDLIYDRAHLPEWFEFVFKKQYSKHKPNLDIMAKKLYKNQYLSQKKKQLQRQIQMFQTLYGRYQALSQSQEFNLNIVGEAQTLKNKSQNIMNKFISYMLMVSEKINMFVDDNIEKALNYNGSGKKVTQQIPLRMPYRMPQQIIRSRAPQKSRQFISQQQFYSKPNVTTSHTMTDYQPNQRITSSPYTPAYRNQQNYQQCSYHQKSMKSMGFQGSRFNYREHMPRWMNNTLSDYYF